VDPTATIVRGLASPLLQVGDLAFDAEMSVTRGGGVTFTRRRIGAGAVFSDHSFVDAREFSIEGIVSECAAIYNLGRPGADNALIAAALGSDQLEGLVGIDLVTRVMDFEARLDALKNARVEVEIVSKVLGRVIAVLVSWTATTAGDDPGDFGRYQMRFDEVLRAGFTISDATEEALGLNGSGGNPGPGGGGPSAAPAEMLEVTP